MSLGCLSAVGTGMVHLHVTTRGHCFLRELWRPHLTSLLPDSRFFQPYLFLSTTLKSSKRKTRQGMMHLSDRASVTYPIPRCYMSTTREKYDVMRCPAQPSTLGATVKSIAKAAALNVTKTDQGPRLVLRQTQNRS